MIAMGLVVPVVTIIVVPMIAVPMIVARDAIGRIGCSKPPSQLFYDSL